MKPLMKYSVPPLLLAVGLALTGPAQAAGRDTINIVGSSTVYPFATVVAERFGRKSGKTPKIESTGSGGGMKLFCSGVGINTPDITNASRRVKKSEFKTCQKNGVKDIIEVQVGFDGIAIANSKKAPQLHLSRKDIFLALAKRVPNPNGSKTLIANPYKTWHDVNASLPKTKIEVLGPPPTSGTRDAFTELAMEGGCKKFGWIKAIKSASKAAKKAGDKAEAKRLKTQYKGICHTVREDGAYIEAGENDNLIVQKLEANPRSLGVFGFSFLDQNTDQIQGSVIDGVEISFDNISDGSYPVSRPLFFYVKKAHIGKVPGIKEYADTFTSEAAFGPDGYLPEKGLIPMSDAMRKKFRDAVDNETPMSM